MARFYFTGDPTFGAGRIKTQIKNTVKKHANKAKKLLLQPTATWDHAVSFDIVEKGDVTSVTTDDEPYQYLDDGTPPHIIRGNPFLNFQENFVPKTTPGSLNSVHGGKSGNYVYPAPQVVSHPGNEARNFTQTALDQLEVPFQNDVEAEIAKSIA